MVVILLVGAVALSACATIDGPRASNTPTPTAATAPLGDSAFDLECNELVTPADLESVFGSHLEPATQRRFGVEPSQIFVTALKQDGALSCDWGQRDEGPSLTFLALPNAAAGFSDAAAELKASSRFRELDLFDASYYNCHYDFPDLPQLNCDWYILAGDVWIAAALRGVADAQYEQPDVDSADEQFVEVVEDSDLVQLLANAVAVTVAAQRLELTQTAASVSSCSELIDASSVSAVLSGEVKIIDVLASTESLSGVATASEGGSMWALSMQRLGYRYCSVSPPPAGGYYSTVVTVAPGGAWAFDSSKQASLDGLGPAISNCTSTQDGPSCFIAVLVGDTLVTVESNEASPVVGLAVIKGVIANLK